MTLKDLDKLKKIAKHHNAKWCLAMQEYAKTCKHPRSRIKKSYDWKSQSTEVTCGVCNKYLENFR